MGPTYITIRSAKHDNSTARTHSFESDHLKVLDSFQSAMLTKAGGVKPHVFVGVDGEPDEAPGNSKTMLAWSDTFVKHDLEGPGLSAYNKVERRMAPLTKDTVGLILPSDSFGTPLINSIKTVDEELEIKNLKTAGEILTSLWLETVIYEHWTFCSCGILPRRGWNRLSNNSGSIAMYLLQAVRCKQRSCCTVPLQGPSMRRRDDLRTQVPAASHATRE